MTFGKGRKVGLPGYSSINVYMEIKVELSDGEKAPYEALWSKLDQQIDSQIQKELKK